MVSDDVADRLSALGSRIRDARLSRNETQERFAARLGVSVPTLRKLENGEPTVSVGFLAEALSVLGKLDHMDRLLAPGDDLFAEWESRRQPRRRRAARSRQP